MKRKLALAPRTIAATLTVAAALAASSAFASSHSDAPLIKVDPQANLTDVYAFIGMRGATKVLNIVVNVHPFCEPGDGAQYDKFSDDALYSIHIANPRSGETLCRYDFKFSPINSGYKNLNTILSYGLGSAAGAITSNTDATRNYTQFYSVTKVVGNSSTRIGTDLITPPPNVGPRTTPFYNDADGRALSGATTNAGLDIYTREAIHSLGDTRVFAGSREDSFFADPPGIFDLLNPRILDNNGSLGDGLGQDGGGVDGFKGYNVMTYALQIPVSELPSGLSYSDPFAGDATGVGVYASVSRPRITLRSASGAPTSSGPWIQVNRLANPLFNEALVALKDKDKYNRTSPVKDAANFQTYAQNPELAFLVNFVYGTSFATTGRADLVAVYIPDVIRVNTATDAVRLPGQAGFSRFGFVGGDTVTIGGNPSAFSGGWPNGRRLGDDVVDIALTALASGPTYSAITVVGDNVASNDQVYHQVFPYAATPHSGTFNRKDP